MQISQQFVISTCIYKVFFPSQIPHIIYSVKSEDVKTCVIGRYFISKYLEDKAVEMKSIIYLIINLRSSWSLKNYDSFKMHSVRNFYNKFTQRNGNFRETKAWKCQKWHFCMFNRKNWQWEKFQIFLLSHSSFGSVARWKTVKFQFISS